MGMLVKALSTRSLSCSQSIVSFLRNFASVHALPLPGRVPGTLMNIMSSFHLTCLNDLRFVYRKYEEACRVSQERCVSRNNAASAWDEYSSGSSNDLKEMHYSYDYVQQLHYPINVQQAGPEYFKTARKCNLLGVSCEPCSYQVNHLIDEAEDVGKGADATISLVHHFFQNNSLKELNAYLYADNCTAQNKNNANIHYLLWRVLTGRHRSLCLSFMLTGHTKFAPDRFFGLIKRKYCRSTVSSIIELERVVKESTHNCRTKHTPASS